MKNVDLSQYSTEELQQLLAIADGEETPPAPEAQREEVAEKPMDRYATFKKNTKEYIGRPLAHIAKNVHAAASDTIDFLNKPADMYAEHFGVKNPSYGQKTRQVYDELTGGLSVPRNQLEKNIDTGIETIASLPVGGPAVKALKAGASLSKLQKIGRFAQSAVAAQKPTFKIGLGAGVAGALGQELQDRPFDIENPYLRGAANLATGVGANIATQAGLYAGDPRNLLKAGKWAAKGAGIPGKIAQWGDFDPEAVETARNASVELTPADALKSPNAKRQQNIMEKTPYVGGKFRQTRERQYEQALEGLGQDKGETLTKEAGAELVLKGSKANYAQHEKYTEKELAGIEKNIAKHIKENPGSTTYDIGTLKKALKASNKDLDEDTVLASLNKSISKLEKEGKLVDGKIPQEYVGVVFRDLKDANIVKGGIIDLPKHVEYTTKVDGFEKDVKKSLKNANMPDLVDPSNARRFIERVKSQFRSEAALEDFKNSPLGQFETKLNSYGKEHMGKVPYNELVEFRRLVDDSTSTFGIHGNKTNGQLKQLSARTNQDIGDFFKGIGHEAYDKWKNFNSYYSNYKKKTLPAINKVLKLTDEGKDIDALMSVMPTKRGGAALENILKSLPAPHEKKELFDIIVRTAGTDNKGHYSLVKTYNYINNLPHMTQNKLLRLSGKTGPEITKYKDVLTTVNNIWKKSAQENYSESGSHMIQAGVNISIARSLAAQNWLGAAKQIGALALATAGSGIALKNQRLVNSMYTAYNMKDMSKGQFNSWASTMSKLDPHFKSVIKSSLSGSVIKGAKEAKSAADAEKPLQSATGEEKGPDLNSMSTEELQKLLAMSEEE